MERDIIPGGVSGEARDAAGHAWARKNAREKTECQTTYVQLMCIYIYMYIHLSIFCQYFIVEYVISSLYCKLFIGGFYMLYNTLCFSYIIYSVFQAIIFFLHLLCFSDIFLMEVFIYIYTLYFRCCLKYDVYIYIYTYWYYSCLHVLHICFLI